MADLLDLPPEILDEIVASSIPEGIEAVCLSCQLLYQVGKKFLPQHRALTKRYRTFTYEPRDDDYEADFSGDDDAGSAQPIRTPLGLLLRAAANPLILRYIQYADLRSSTFLSDKYSPAGKRLRCDPTARHALEQLLQASTLLKDAKFDFATALDAYLDAMNPDGPRSSSIRSTYALDLALLMLMPNVRVLALPSDWKNFPADWPDEEDGGLDDEDRKAVRGMWRILDLMVSRARENPSGETPHGVLTHLETLMPLIGPGYDNRASLAVHEAFLALPTVREFYCASLVALDDGYTGIPFQPRYIAEPTALETMWLNSVIIGEEEIAAILKGRTSLRQFRHRHETKWHGCGYDWDAGHFLRGVMGAVGAYLEELLIGNTAGINCFNNGSGVTSLRGFERLKNLEMGLEFLDGPPCGGEADVRYEELCPGEVVTGPNETPPLVDMLPDTLETCILYCTEFGHEVVLEKLFADFDETHWAERLPRLRQLRVISGAESWKWRSHRRTHRIVRPDMCSPVPFVDSKDQRWDPLKRALKLFNENPPQRRTFIDQSFDLPIHVTGEITDWWSEDIR